MGVSAADYRGGDFCEKKIVWPSNRFFGCRILKYRHIVGRVFACSIFGRGFESQVPPVSFSSPVFFIPARFFFSSAEWTGAQADWSASVPACNERNARTAPGKKERIDHNGFTAFHAVGKQGCLRSAIAGRVFVVFVRQVAPAAGRVGDSRSPCRPDCRSRRGSVSRRPSRRRR